MEEVFFSICWLRVVARGRGRRCWVRNLGQASKVRNGLQRRHVLPLGEHRGQRAGAPSEGDALPQCSRDTKGFYTGSFSPFFFF